MVTFHHAHLKTWSGRARRDLKRDLKRELKIKRFPNGIARYSRAKIRSFSRAALLTVVSRPKGSGPLSAVLFKVLTNWTTWNFVPSRPVVCSPGYFWLADAESLTLGTRLPVPFAPSSLNEIPGSISIDGTVEKNSFDDLAVWPGCVGRKEWVYFLE